MRLEILTIECRRRGMSTEDMLTILEEAVENGRIKPYLAAYIAAEVLETDTQSPMITERLWYEQEFSQ
jgi:hypothetical protein